MSGTDVNYDVGYILNGEFVYLQKNITSSSLANNVVAEKSGSFYWCINNISDDVISFSAAMQYGLNDLVYRNYGGDVISVDESCVIRLGAIQSLLPLKEITGIYLYNYEQKITKEFPADTENIEYKVEQRGTYSIYALTKGGEIISLNSYVSVEYENKNFDIDENGNNEESIMNGIINL